MCPAAHQPLHSLQSPCHCEASAHTGCGNPYPQRLPTQGESFSVGATLAVARGQSPAPTHPMKTHRASCKTRCHWFAIRNSKDPTRQKRPAPGRSFSNIPYITIYPVPRLILTPLEDLQNIVEMALLLFQLRLFLRGNALRRLLGGLLCLRGSLSGHRL